MRLWKYRAFIATALFILVSTAFFIVFSFLIKVKSIVKTLSKSQNDSFE
nr:photosystem II protein M [Cotinus coggygria]USH58484.1 photosystem II protein M [Cotinus coggygria]